MTTKQDYYPYGMVMYGRNGAAQVSDNHRYGFNGMEKDDELKGNGNSYDFGARLYDPRVGRWLSRDPQEINYPSQSPYVSMDNSPVYKMDPDGESAIVKLKKKKIKIKSKIFFYGDEADFITAKTSARNIQRSWNKAKGKVMINGVEYKVKFKIKGRKVSEKRAIKKAATNTSAENNFIRIVDGSTWNASVRIKSSFYRTPANDGVFIKSELGDGKTTDAHEWGHGADWYEPGECQGGRHDCTISGGVPGIMSARGVPVSDDYGYDSQPSGAKTVDPSKRKVLESDVNKLNINKTKLAQDGEVSLGNVTNTIFKTDASVMTQAEKNVILNK